jgi:acetoin utilization deacetylase AcuC-like enzyme
MPHLEAHRPQMLFFSPPASMGIAKTTWRSGLRLEPMLEGGYDLSALGRSVAAHIKTLAAL